MELPKPISLEIKDSTRVKKMAYTPRIISNGIVIGDMDVTYNSDKTYRYYSIPKPVFDHIVTASSVGKALQPIVADKTIKYEKI